MDSRRLVECCQQVFGWPYSMTELGPALPQLVRVSFRLFVVLTSDDIVYGPDPLSPLIKNPIIGINSLINVLDFMPKYAILYACIFRC